MDRLVYTALSGARSTLDRQAITSNNLANVSTAGYRAETAAFRSVALPGAGRDSTRVMAVETTTGADFSPGALQHTGRDLDVAIEGAGWLVVQGPDGKEAYTRAGHLQVSPNGVLLGPGGRPVLSDAGPISIPPGTRVAIGADGTISSVPGEPPLNDVSTLGRLRLVNPPAATLVRGPDGLFRTRDGSRPRAAEGVRVLSGSIEGSNVNPAEAMVGMINTARQFELQLKLLQNAEANARSASQLLTLT